MKNILKIFVALIVYAILSSSSVKAESSCVYVSKVDTWSSCESGIQYAEQVEYSSTNNLTQCNDVPIIRSCSVSCEIMKINDIDDNQYEIVNIGEQTWMAENLKTTRYRDENSIGNNMSWYNNNVNNKNTYGGLYTYAAANNNQICPDGWKVPNETEWQQLFSYLGGDQSSHPTGYMYNNIGKKLKTSNRGGTDDYGFSALAGGIYDTYYGNWNYRTLDESGYWWIKDSSSGSWAKTVNDLNSSNSIWVQGPRDLSVQASVRCLKIDSCPVELEEDDEEDDEEGNDEDNDGNAESNPGQVSCTVTSPSNYPFYTDQNITIQAILSGDIDYGDVDFTWSGTFIDDGQAFAQNNNVISNSFDNPGTYEVRLRVEYQDTLYPTSGEVVCTANTGSEEILVEYVPKIDFDIPIKNAPESGVCPVVWNIESEVDIACDIVTEFGESFMVVDTDELPIIDKKAQVKAGNSYRLECNTETGTVVSGDFIQCIKPNLIQR